MLTYHHSFRVRASLARVNAFHHDPANMARITPPPLVVQRRRYDESPEGRGESSFTLWLGPLPLHWRLTLEPLPPAGFVDHQVEGPFAAWTQRHVFVPIDDGNTEVRDSVEASLRRHPGWWLVGSAMWLGMPFLFAYRAWRTRRLLEGQPCQSV